jgi:hypothetical protein
MLIDAIKAVHAVLFLLLAAAVLYIFVCGVVGRGGRALAWSIAICAIELAIIALNGWRCPLTGLAERLGAKSGSVAGLFVPRWSLPFVFPVFGALFGIGLALVGLRGVRRKLR